MAACDEWDCTDLWPPLARDNLIDAFKTNVGRTSGMRGRNRDGVVRVGAMLSPSRRGKAARGQETCVNIYFIGALLGQFARA